MFVFGGKLIISCLLISLMLKLVVIILIRFLWDKCYGMCRVNRLLIFNKL